MAHVIGWKERADFPHLGLRRVLVKIDTGARTSALGVESYQIDSPKGVIAITLARPTRNEPSPTPIILPLVARISVRSSNGCEEVRPLIETSLRLGPVERVIRLTLTRRPQMRHQVLLGRQALSGLFVVDPGRMFLLKRSP